MCLSCLTIRFNLDSQAFLLAQIIMKFLKRLGATTLVLLLSIILFRGPLYRSCVTYRSIGTRGLFEANDAQLIHFLEDNDVSKQAPSVKSIIEQSLSLASEQLHFTVANNPVDPNRLIHSYAAHCVGYAEFFSTTCTYYFKNNRLENTWHAQPQQGQLYLFGYNVHPWFSTPFFKDHDFVIIRNKMTGEVIAVDPTVHDYLYISTVSVR